MPQESIRIVAAIVGAFAFFGGLLPFSGLTWADAARSRRD